MHGLDNMEHFDVAQAGSERLILSGIQYWINKSDLEKIFVRFFSNYLLFVQPSIVSWDFLKNFILFQPWMVGKVFYANQRVGFLWVFQFSDGFSH